MTNFFKVLSFAPLLFSYGFAQTIPNLCPNERNLPQICKSLSEIKKDQVLVFSDGTKLPACLLETVNIQMTIDIAKLKLVSTKLMFALSKWGLQPKEIEALMSHPQVALDIGVPKELENLIRSYATLQTSIKEAPKFESKPFSLPSLVTEAQEPIIELVENRPAMILDRTAKSKIVSRLKQTKPAAGEDQGGSVICAPDTDTFSMYTQKEGMVFVGKALSQYPRANQLVAAGHEVGHGFDTCRGASGFWIFKYHPIFKELVDCFRHSVGQFRGPMSEGCDLHETEVFSDYMGIQAAEKHIKSHPVKEPAEAKPPKEIAVPPGYESVFYFIDTACSSRSLIPEDVVLSHPRPEKRLFDIFLRNPTIAKSMNCPAQPYCDPEKGLVDPTATTTSESSNVLKSTIEENSR